MIKDILSGKIFGFAHIDITTPNELKEAYSDFPPVIKKQAIGIDDIGDLMKQYAKDHKLMKQKRTNLISSYSGKGITMMTPMIKFLVEHGLSLDKIYWVIQYDEKRPFKKFRDEVTEHRLRGDGYEVYIDDETGERAARKIVGEKLKDSSLAADTYKLLGNTGMLK